MLSYILNLVSHGSLCCIASIDTKAQKVRILTLKKSISAPHNSAVDAQYALTDSQLAGLVDPVVLLVDPVVLLPILNSVC
eukprot:SAG11_NODE_1444_length_4893_cov_7.649979_2_plen_80_part_00